MEYNLIPRELKLREYDQKTEKMHTYAFDEPTLLKLEYFWRYVKQERYIKACKVLGIERKSEVTIETIETLIELIYGKSTKSTGEKGFYPASIDFCAKRYGCTLKAFMKETTYSELVTIYDSIEYNTNIEIGKPQNNNKFTREEMTEERLSQYEDILREVEEVEKKIVLS